MDYIGPVERKIYGLREDHPLIIPQLDPDNYTLETAHEWFDEVKNAGISCIAIGGSILDALHTQELLDVALKEYDFIITQYLANNTSSVRGLRGRTAVYWMQIPNALNTFYGWDGLISNSLNIEKCELEPIPSIYVFDDRDSRGTANWISRSYPIPREKPEISLAVAKAAQYLGIRFYIMAGGSGSIKPPSIKHIEKLTKKTRLFVIPTSGINTVDQAKEMFSAGADAVHIGNRLELDGGFEILRDMVKASQSYPGKSFL